MFALTYKAYSQADTSATAGIDTLFAYMDGQDSIFILEQDTVVSDSIVLRHVAASDYQAYSTVNAKTIVFETFEIGIHIGFQTKLVNDGLYGFHIGNVFTKGALPYYEESSADAMQWLIELKPKSLRFPAGGSAKFMHLLPYRNIDGLPGLDPIKGYGYDIREIIRYYDVTDNQIDILTEADIDDVIIDLDTDNICDGCYEWMNVGIGEPFKDDFEGFYNKWEQQESLPADAPTAIEQFVALVNDIQTTHPGHTVDIILCLNIFSESAPRCQEIVRYLKLESKNDVADLYVAGVEIGNENYFKSSIEMLGMENFEDYWSFINGGESNTDWWDDFANQVFSTQMKNNHNYIAAFKLDNSVSCKIGIPATNIDVEGYALKESGELAETGGVGATWNEMLRSHYSDRAADDGPFSFDAVILHPYYTAKDNYQDIAMLFDDSYSCPIFDFASLDAQLAPAFQGILGTTTPPLTGNFRDFILTRYLESFEYHNDILDFGLTTNIKKDLWATEWNLLDEFTAVPGETNLKERMDMYHNSFAGAFVLQEWWLQNIKLNYTFNFRNNFFTYAHMHNYHGTEYQNTLLLDADCADFKRYGLDPEDYINDRLYLRRTNYFVMKHLSPIAGQDLKYIRNNQYISYLNPNIQTTTFLNTTLDTIYVYYSNIRSSDQNYLVNGQDIGRLLPDHPIYGEPIGIQFGTAFIKCIDALQPYSTSGKSTIYDLNTCYDCHSTFDFWHPYEIMPENPPSIRYFENVPACITTPDINEICVTVPGYSIGYFKIPVSAVYATPKFSIITENTDLIVFPNPAGTTIRYTSHYAIEATRGEIHSVAGIHILNFDPAQINTIDISTLSSGVYSLTLIGEFGKISTMFIKQ